jgi:hypothetical protein
MSENKIDKGKLFNKLHQLQKRLARFFKNKQKKNAELIEHRKKHLLEKIKGTPKLKHD